MKDMTVTNVLIEMAKLELSIWAHAPNFYKAVLKGAFKAVAVGGSVYLSKYLQAVKTLMVHGRGAIVDYLATFDIEEFEVPGAFEQWDIMTALTSLAEEKVNGFIGAQTQQYEETTELTEEDVAAEDYNGKVECANCGRQYDDREEYPCPTCTSGNYFSIKGEVN